MKEMLCEKFYLLRGDLKKTPELFHFQKGIKPDVFKHKSSILGGNEVYLANCDGYKKGLYDVK